LKEKKQQRTSFKKKGEPASDKSIERKGVGRRGESPFERALS